MNRRNFVKTSSLIAAGLSISELTLATLQIQNKLPQWKGFNVLDFFSPNPEPSAHPTTEEHFKWMRDWGFDFIRVPIAYPYYLNIDRSKDIQPDDVYKINTEATDRIDALVEMAHKYNMHVSLNLHRAPGYCINAGFMSHSIYGKMKLHKRHFIFIGIFGLSDTRIYHQKKSVLILSTNPV